MSVSLIGGAQSDMSSWDDLTAKARGLWMGCRDIVPDGYFISGKTRTGQGGIGMKIWG